MIDKPANRPGFSVNRFQLGSLATNLPFPAAPSLVDGNTFKGEFQLPASSDLKTPRFFAMQLDEILLPNEPLISVTSAKNIVETVVAGGDYTVKEMIGAQDWKIKIQGYAVREGNRDQAVATSLVPTDYPEEWLRRLILLYRRNRALAVTCQLMTYYNVKNLVINDIDFPAIAGASDYFAYQISASSDESSLAKLIRRK
ncbi:MAG: DUF6046 domain-containing protein [Pseudomonadota bacterium]